MYLKNVLNKDMTIHFYQENRERGTMFLLNILIHSCIIILYTVEKFFCHYCLQSFSTAEILKLNIKDRFKINTKQKITMRKRADNVKFKTCQRKIKSLFIIYGCFENILQPEDNGKPNSKESYTNKYQRRIACSYYISSNKRRASNKCHLLVSATPLGIHIEISASL